MPTFIVWAQKPLRLSKYHPVLSCMITGLWGAIALLAGIADATGQGGAARFLVSAIGVVFLALVLYAAYDTHWFGDWIPTGEEGAIQGHRLARGIGPLSISAAIVGGVLLLSAVYLVMRVVARGRLPFE